MYVHIFFFTYAITPRYMLHTRSPLILYLDLCILILLGYTTWSFDPTLDPARFLVLFSL
jgi:hypothetical protein